MALRSSLSFPEVGVFMCYYKLPMVSLALACVSLSRVSCGNSLQKAALGDDSGLLVADDYKKWNVSAFLRAKVAEWLHSWGLIERWALSRKLAYSWIQRGHRHMRVHTYAIHTHCTHLPPLMRIPLFFYMHIKCIPSLCPGNKSQLTAVIWPVLCAQSSHDSELCALCWLVKL